MRSPNRSGTAMTARPPASMIRRSPRERRVELRGRIVDEHGLAPQHARREREAVDGEARRRRRHARVPRIHLGDHVDVAAVRRQQPDAHHVEVHRRPHGLGDPLEHLGHVQRRAQHDRQRLERRQPLAPPALALAQHRVVDGGRDLIGDLAGRARVPVVIHVGAEARGGERADDAPAAPQRHHEPGAHAAGGQAHLERVRRSRSGDREPKSADDHRLAVEHRGGSPTPPRCSARRPRRRWCSGPRAGRARARRARRRRGTSAGSRRGDRRRGDRGGATGCSSTDSAASTSEAGASSRREAATPATAAARSISGISLRMPWLPYPAGIVMMGGCSLVPVSTSVKTNIRKVNSRFDGMSRSSIQNQEFR